MYLDLLTEIDHDEIISTLESIIQKYRDQIAPHAFSLLQNFVKCLFFFPFSLFASSLIPPIPPLSHTYPHSGKHLIESAILRKVNQLDLLHWNV